MDVENELNELTIDNFETSEILRLKTYLDQYGIKYIWLSEQLGFERSWCTEIFKGKYSLTDENKKKIEEILSSNQPFKF